MPWNMILKQSIPFDLDASGLTKAISQDDYESLAQHVLPALKPGRELRCSDLFEITAGGGSTHVIAGDLARVHGLAAGWSVGRLIIDANVGAYAGREMRGGEVFIKGTAANHAGSMMKGGCLTIEGDVGEQLGGPSPGNRTGMRGGAIIVQGRTGPLAGFRMRRGTLVLRSHVAAGMGCDMFAGTIVAEGTVAAHAGIGMRRGTLIMQTAENRSSIDSAARFSSSREFHSSALPLMASHLLLMSPRTAERLTCATNQPLRRSLGDLSCGGRGEIWWLD